MNDQKVIPMPKDFGRLSDLLRMDTWTIHQGLSEITNDYIEQSSPDDRRDSLKLYFRLMDIWKSGDHPAEKLPPAYFVEWARLKRYPLSWESWALANDWLTDEPKVANFQRERQKAIGREAVAKSRDILMASSKPTTVKLARVSDRLAVVLTVFNELCSRGDLPSKTALAYSLDESAGKKGCKDGTATPESRNLASILLDKASENTATCELRINSAQSVLAAQ